MSKELSKAIMNKSRTKNKYLEWPTRENFQALKKAKNKFYSMTKKLRRQYFEETTKDDDLSNKKFWNTLTLFLTSKRESVNLFYIYKKRW